MLEELSCENRVVGLKQTRRLLAAGRCRTGFLARMPTRHWWSRCWRPAVQWECCRDGVYHVTAGPGRRHRRGDRRSRRPQPLKRFFRNKISYSVENKGSHPNKSLERSSLHAYF